MTYSVENLDHVDKSTWTVVWNQDLNAISCFACLSACLLLLLWSILIFFKIELYMYIQCKLNLNVESHLYVVDWATVSFVDRCSPKLEKISVNKQFASWWKTHHIEHQKDDSLHIYWLSTEYLICAISS